MYENNIIILRKGDKEFPSELGEMEDPVKELYCIGNVSLLAGFKAAVVGARKCSEYGRQAALRIGKDFACRSIVTVSGMAAGIDGLAHQGALSRGGGTIAVLGCGPDVCYPRVNRELYREISEKGLIISEYPPGAAPKPWRFPMRNRIIAALSSAVIVAEAGEKSGAMITAVRAAEMGTEVFALPGNITSPYSIGTNRLIRDGARIITSIESLMEEIEALRPAGGAGFAAGFPTGFAEKFAADFGKVMDQEEKKVYDLVAANSGATLDFLCGKLGENPLKINRTVSSLEMKGLIYYELGKIFIANLEK